jgi:glycosyltransferase involved in cell wall biosynthesis
MTIEISVITCSHNPRPAYLQLVLDALRAQTLDKRRWEYLLVDNANETPLSSRVELNWHPNSRHMSEGRLGLTAARLRAIRESTGGLLVFVDDDNLLDPHYLETALQLASDWPEIGAFSGQVQAQFEERPADWTRKYWNRLAIREFDKDRWSNVPCLDQTTPNGAGLCVRRWVAMEYVSYHANGRRKFVLDRIGENLLSAGDLDLATTACDLGLGNALFTTLKLTHLIPRERLQEDYLLRLVEAQTFSDVVLGSFRSNGHTPVRPRLRTVLADRLRLAMMDGRERRFILAARKGERVAHRFLANSR